MPSACRADFVLTMASGVYQHTDGRTKVVIGTKNSARGIFVFYARQPIAAQEFNIETLPPDAGTHVFIRFDDDAQPPVYSEVWAGEKHYRVTGNLTLLLGEGTTVSIDNNNPYLSIVTEGRSATETPTESPAILGFAGLNEVVRASGNAAMVLAANQLDAKISLMMRPYVVRDQELTFNGRPVSTPTIGTFVRANSECLNTGTLILTGAQLAKVQAAKSEDARVKILEAIFKANRAKPPLKGQLILRADPTSVILLDVREKNVREMRTLTAQAGKRKICVISDLTVG